MKKLLLSLALAILLPASLFAQDVKIIEAQYDSEGFPIPDLIINQLNADTSAEGELLHDVYQLELNEEYTITRSIVMPSPATLTAPEHNAAEADMKPPVIRVEANEDGSQPSATLVFVRPGADVEISNIYFSGITTAGNWLEGNFLRPSTPGISIHLKDLIIDYMGWSIITNLDPAVEGVSYYSDGVYVKNAQNVGDFHSPFYFLNTAPVDSFVARNVTYFQSHGYFLQSRAAQMDYVEIDHSTLANVLKIPLLHEELLEAKITNNVFYNTEASGWTAQEYSDQDRDGIPWGIVNVDTLAGNETDTLEAPMAEADRRILVKNNVWYQSPTLTQFIADADTLMTTEMFFNERTQAMFDDDEAYPHLEASNNQEVQFSFTNLTEPGSAGEHATEEMLAYVATVRSGEGVVDFWGYEGDVTQFPDANKLVVEWPLTENLAHDITTVQDDLGLPVGSLTWFPDAVPNDAEDPDGLPTQVRLVQNYPNPFNPSTTIRFELDAATEVTLEVFDVLGQRVATVLKAQTFPAGRHDALFEAAGLSSGMYIYRLSTPSTMQSKRMLLVK